MPAVANLAGHGGLCRFESTYTTEWPAVVEKGWGIGNAFSLNIFNFPGEPAAVRLDIPVALLLGGPGMQGRVTRRLGHGLRLTQSGVLLAGVYGSGPNCLVEELSHLGILQLTTLIPAAVFFLLYIPSGILRLLGEHKQHTYRYKQTRDHFWHYSLFWLVRPDLSTKVPVLVSEWY